MPNLLTPIGGKTKLFDERKLKAAIGEALDHAAKDAITDFKKTTATWDNKPTFSASKDGEYARNVGTDNEIYHFVNAGTKPHEIRPVNAPALAFNVVSTPKTTPGVLGSGPGGSSGPVAFAQVVQHPGTRAREFTKAIAEDAGPKLQRAMDEELQKALG